MRGLTKSSRGNWIECNLDLVLSNDITSPIAIKNFKQIGVEKVFDPTKIALVPDHYVPNKDIKSAEQAKQVRDFAREQGITHYYEVGCMGVEHALLPEKGVVTARRAASSARTATPAPTAHWAHSPPALVPPISPQAWPPARRGSRCPSAIKFVLTGKLSPRVSGKDVILHIIGMIGVDGALYKSMEFVGAGRITRLSMDDRLYHLQHGHRGRCARTASSRWTT